METVTVAILIGLYFLPAIIANKRHAKARVQISVLNLVLGWTLLGWIVALVWAFTPNVDAAPAKLTFRQRL
jgi:Superinfection immunity protein